MWGLYLLALLLFKLFHHELWKDEWQAWFVARDMNFFEVLGFLHYEGHPALWYLYLKPFTWVAELVGGPGDFWLQLAHFLVVAALSFQVLVRWAGPWWLKLAFVFSYFMLFEYAMVSRGYALVGWVLLSLVHFLNKNQDRGDDRWLGFYFFLLCQTEVYGVFMALALGLGMLYDQGIEALWKRKQVSLGMLAGFLVFVISVFPRSSDHISRTQEGALSMGEKLFNTLQGIGLNTWIPGILPDTSAFGASGVGILLSVIILGVFGGIFYREPKKLIAVGSYVLFVLMFGALFYAGGIRQWGMGFLFMWALILWSYDRQRMPVMGAVFLILTSAISTLHGLKAIRFDFDRPFTNGREAAAFLLDKVPANVPIVGINQFEMAPLAGYLGARPLYGLPSGEPQTHFKWLDKVYIPSEAEIKLFADFKKVGGLIVVSAKPLDEARFPNVRLWQQFDGESFKRENFYIYTLQR